MSFNMETLDTNLPSAPTHEIVAKKPKKKSGGHPSDDSEPSNSDGDEYIPPTTRKTKRNRVNTGPRRDTQLSALADDLLHAYRLTMGYTSETPTDPSYMMPFLKLFLEKKGVKNAATVGKLKYNLCDLATSAATKTTKVGDEIYSEMLKEKEKASPAFKSFEGLMLLSRKELNDARDSITKQMDDLHQLHRFVHYILLQRDDLKADVAVLVNCLNLVESELYQEQVMSMKTR